MSGELSIDSYYLLIFLEYGVIGFIVYYGMIACSIYYSMKWTVKLPVEATELALLTPLGVSLTSFFVIKAVFSNQDNHPLAFMMMGMICALVYRARKGLSVTHPGPAAIGRIAP